jgi:photosystem II stability/assembly factor-like uncharacterized protein
MRASLCFTAALLLASSATLAAQGAPAASPFAGLTYRNIGPAAGGRLTRAVGIPGDPSTYYAATASGGVWKSTDGGHAWRPVFDDQPISSIGSIAVAPSDPNVVYVGSGEANIRGNVAAGNGIYVSRDAGKTWTHAWKQEGQIGTIAVHPTNADIAFAAVLGHAFGPNAERGVYRTTDGGKSWVQVLKRDVNTGASDVAIDRTNPRVIFAGFWQARRYPWDLQSGGPGSSLWVSRDGGDTWTQLTGKGLPDGIWGKVGVAVAPSDGNRVYTLIEADSGGLFRSDDGGGSWTRINRDRALRQRAWYYTTLTVDPTNPDRIWFPQVPLLKSIDGGRTITYLKGYHHGDFHDVWIDPANPKRIIAADDGGPEISLDGGESWRMPRLPISQFYHVSVDSRTPYHVAGAMQDLGTAQCPSNSLYSGGIAPSDCHYVGGGEAGHVVSDPSDPNIVYAGEYLGIWTRYDHRTGETRNVSRWPENPSGWGGEQMRYRFQWTAGAAVSPHDSKVVYHAAQMLFRSTDGGQTWQALSGDLTRNDKSKQQWTGGPITGDGTGVETYGTIFAIAESPKQAGIIWVGSDDGLVHLSRDSGATWTNVTASMPGFPEWGTVSLIEPSPHDAGTAYVVVDRHRLDDMKPYLYRTTDFGKSWKRLDASLAPDIYLHAVREDPARKGLLYLGTERGVMVSTDDGAAWHSLKLNMPTVAVHDLVVKDNDLVVATHGRSIWILDDLTPVRTHSPAIAARSVHLYAAPAATQWHYRGAYGRENAGPNPPRGATVSYWLKSKPSGPLTLQVLDGRGTVVRTLSSEPEPLVGASEYEGMEDAPKGALTADSGMQRATWDFAHRGAVRIRNGKIDSGDPSQGPQAVPGTYTLRLIAGGDTAITTVEVKADPRDPTSQADREAQLAFALEVRDQISRVTGLVEGLRRVERQLHTRVEALGDRPEAKELVAAARAAATRARALEAKLHNPDAEITYDILAQKGGARVYSRLAPLLNWASEGTGAPTQGMREVFSDQRKEVDGVAAEVAAFMAGEVAAVNAMAARPGLGFVVPEGGEK